MCTVRVLACSKWNTFVGAAETMLLCDGLKCDEAFHSFCLAIPLQTIPDGDWLCPICIHQRVKVSKKKESLVSQNGILFLTYLILGYDDCQVEFSLAKSFTILWGCLATSFEILLGCLRCCMAFNIQESDI